MKKLALLLFISSLMMACGSLRMADVTNLSEGMTKVQVDNIMRSPVRLLSTNYMQDGIVEVYEYITYRQDSYAIEFWNGRLTGYEFMYENVTPTPNRPGHVVRPPSNPPRPSTPNRPGINRPESNRPGSNTGGRPSAGGGRPGNSNNNTIGRPNSNGNNNNNSGTIRPSYRSTPENTSTETPPVTTEKEKEEKK